MGNIDCIVEMRKEAFHEGMLEVAKNMLIENFSVETVSRITELPISEITRDCPIINF
ncbi:MAG: hypothetical protein IJG09_00650 [Methanobrevibacter sp.]|nr:hypothetical protein [Methanobrevibacter sp.]